MNERDTSGRFARYLESLDSLVGAKSIVYNISPRVPEDGRVIAVAYRDIPEPGYITGFSYGLSLVRHQDWGECGRELSITVRSADIEWAKVPARSVAALRGMCSYSHGQAIGHVERYVDGSDMSSILLKEPAFQWGSKPIDLGLDELSGAVDLIEIVGVFPVYATERKFVYESGFGAFWDMTWDRLDPTRGPIV